MKQPDILRDIEIGQKLVQQKKIDHAGEKYRDAARDMLSINMNSFAIDYYTYASDLFISSGKYLKAIHTELTIYNIHKINGNVLEMANSYEKVASYYKHYLNEPYQAGWFYLMSAKHHEENQNYFSAFKKARFASECFELTENNEKKRTSNSLALRMALQSGYYEKAGEHALRLHKFSKKDYSHHYISVCVKGFKSFLRTDRYEECLMFVNEIVHAHYVAHMPQNKIVKYLIEAQKLHLQVNKTANPEYNKHLLEELEGQFSKIVNYSLELRQYADSIGLSDISDYFYLQQQQYRTQLFWKENKYAKYFSYKAWQISCLYGTSLTRWLLFSIAIIVFFGCSFSGFDCPPFFPQPVKDFLYSIYPAIKVTSIQNSFSPFYYSIVTFTTLGYGDITPEWIFHSKFTSISAQSLPPEGRC